jgi:ATP-dependent protease ClpP protease subunit
MAATWYALSETENGEAEVTIYDEIGAFGLGSKQFLSDLQKLKGKHVHLRINSPGGSVIEGTAIYNALRRHEGGLTVHIDALAASMASVISMAGAPVLIADNALFMLHNPWTVSMGGSEDLRKEADLLDKLKANLRNAYVRKTGMKEEQVQDLMDRETWLDSVEAVALGFADAIEEGVAAAASVTPKELRARFDNFRNGMEANPANPETVEEVIPVVEVTEAAPVEPVVEEVIESAEEPEVSELPAPNASADVKALAAQISALNARAIAAEARAEKAEADVRHISNLLETLEASKGIAAASVVPPVSPVATSSDPVAAYKAAIEAGDKKAAAEIFAKHKAELYAAAKKIS